MNIITRGLGQNQTIITRGFSSSGTAEKGEGPFTQLSVMGIPGRRLSFLPKVSISHAGLFTQLSVMGTPGPIREFLAKTPADVVEPIVEEYIRVIPQKFRGAAIDDYRIDEIEPRYELVREDAEMLRILIESIISGVIE